MADPHSIRLKPPDGAELEIELLAERIGMPDTAGAGGSAWRLAGELDPREVELLRMVSGRLGDGRLLAIAAVRPAGAAGHGEEVVAGLLDSNGELVRLAQALLSTEYDADERLRRIGVELYETTDSVAMRVAGTATGPPAADEEGWIRVGLELRHAGARGAGTYEQVTVR